MLTILYLKAGNVPVGFGLEKPGLVEDNYEC